MRRRKTTTEIAAYRKEVEAWLEREHAEEVAGQLSDPDERAAAQKAVRRRKQHGAMVLKKYGMTPAAYREMYTIQRGCCAICDQPFERLSVDHCHDTERVRGLLCSRCNLALGVIRENIKAARGMALYIERRCIPAKQAGKLDPMV